MNETTELKTRWLPCWCEWCLAEIPPAELHTVAGRTWHECCWNMLAQAEDKKQD